jgi:hypothetical protein
MTSMRHKNGERLMSREKLARVLLGASQILIVVAKVVARLIARR